MSGNANAHTGKRGIEIIDTYVDSIIKLLGCKKSEVLVSSTGVIGEKFNPNLIVKKISKKNKCNYRIDYIANGDAFLTKPEKTVLMARKIIKRIIKGNTKWLHLK